MIDYKILFSLKNKIAAVTGGAGLIGKEIAIALAQAGAKVLLLDVDEKRGHEIEKLAKKPHLLITFVKFDIANTAEYEILLPALAKREGSISIWVNSAYPRPKDWGNKVEKVSAAAWHESVRLLMDSYCLLTKEVAHLMSVNSIRGSIINISSIQGVVGPSFSIYEGTEMTSPAAYTAIKGGIISFGRYVASYYGKKGIRVNTICPGGIYDGQDPIFVKNYEHRTPLGRMARAEDIAPAVVFLASEASTYITGITLMVGGGWTAI